MLRQIPELLRLYRNSLREISGYDLIEMRQIKNDLGQKIFEYKKQYEIILLLSMMMIYGIRPNYQDRLFLYRKIIVSELLELMLDSWMSQERYSEKRITSKRIRRIFSKISFLLINLSIHPFYSRNEHSS